MTITVDNVTNIISLNTVAVNTFIPANSGSILICNPTNNITGSTVDLSQYSRSNVNEVINISNVYTKTVAISANVKSVSGSNLLVYGNLNPLSKISEIRDDFLARSNTAGLGWLGNTLGTGSGNTFANAQTNITSKAMGVIATSTGTTSAGRSSMGIGLAQVQLGVFDSYIEYRVAINTVYDAIDQWAARIGYNDNDVAGIPVDGAWFEYNQGISGANWIISTTANSLLTTTTTSVQVSAGKWYKLGIYVPVGGAYVAYYIDGNLVGTISTTVPVAVSRQTGPSMTAWKLAGTNARILYTDYFYGRFIGDR